ncbi:MAG: hypothetical protein Q9216_007088, partial [Gyalolechia sp. 2 TL-2023]
FPTRSWTYHAYTLWLFNRSDLKTVIAPTAIFAFCCGLAQLAGKRDFDLSDSAIKLLKRMPVVLVWTWTNLLMKSITNQRLSGSILDNTINKPWRPFLSKRCTADESRRLLFWVIGLAFALSWQLGAVGESLTLAVSTWMYNDLGGANQGSWIRNFLNAAGLASLYYGATAIAIDRAAGAGVTRSVWIHLAVFAAVQLSTVRTQDRPDRHGDAARRGGGKTMPLVVYGEGSTRWVTAAAIVAWSFLWPAVWKVGPFGLVPPVVFGIFWAVRIVEGRSAAADRLSWTLGGWWVVGLLLLVALPVLRVLGMVGSRVHWWAFLWYTPDEWLRDKGLY